METGTLLTIVGFVLQLVIQLLILAHFSGKFASSTEATQKQVGQLAMDRLKDNERMDKIEEKTHEVKETFKEFTKEIRAMINVK